MALVDIWKSSPDQLLDKRVPQIIAFAGDGKLGHGKPSTKEFREFLGVIPSDLLQRYIGECLAARFDGSGFALQDLINELGRRLGFEVTFGRYRGTPGQIGFDGLWKSTSDSRTIVIEVKTTDSYSMDLDVIAGYRRSLIKSMQTTEELSSALIVIGREDTGGLEAQIRGSRHAWDIRLISISSLLRLLSLKESLDDPSVIIKIRSILTPQEFTKVDGIVEIAFLTKEEIRDATSLTIEDIEQKELSPDETITSTAMANASVANFAGDCTKRVQQYLGQLLIKRSRTIYETPDADILVSCLVSREYDQGEYWFGYRRHVDDALAKASKGFLALGCGTSSRILLIPHESLLNWRDDLNATSAGKSLHWHIRVVYSGDKWFILRKAGGTRIDVTQYYLSTGASH